MAEPRQVFRIVIGAYGEAQRAASAISDLYFGGLASDQLCLIGKPPLPLPPAGASPPVQSNEPRWPAAVNLAGADRRQVAGEEVEVSAPALFDKVWSETGSTGETLAPWMTRAQSKAIVDSLGSGALLLLVSAASATEQVRASQVQLIHHPSIMQSYSFTG